MKVVLIGTGSMLNEYNSASFLIDNDIVIDMQNGMCKNLFKMYKDPTEITHVLLTHFHGDHYFDIPFYFLAKSKSNNKKAKVYLSKDGISKCKKLLKLGFPNPAKDILKTVKPEFITTDKFKVNSYKVEKVLVDHGRQKPCYGYIFDYKKVKVGFTGDTTMCQNLKYISSVCSYVFLDCMFINGTNKHMGINYLQELINEFPNTKFFPVHMENDTREMLKKLNLKNVILCKDYDEIEIK